jgi:hypothetical protein
MSDALDLRQTQQIFWSLITAPEGVRPALEDLVRRGELPAAGIDDLIVGDERLGAADRLDIYANMYFFRLHDCLREDFACVAASLGDDHFNNLVTDYLLRHPSEHPSLRYLGRHLAPFVAGHPLGAEFPWLADLARLEWARVEAFDAPDGRPLMREDLARLPQETVGERRLGMLPSVALLRLEHDVVRAWSDLKKTADSGAPATGHAHQCAPAPVKIPRRRTNALVWRGGFVVYHRSVKDEEARCLDLAAGGESLGAICQKLAAGHSVTKATAVVGRLLQTWIDDGILSGLDLPA